MCLGIRGSGVAAWRAPNSERCGGFGSGIGREGEIESTG